MPLLLLIISKVKMSYNILVRTYGNRIDKLEKMIWFQFSTKVLQIAILDIDDRDRISVNIQIKIHL